MKLEQVAVTVTIYKSDNIDYISTDEKDKTITVFDKINEIWFFYHSYKFSYNEETKKLELTGNSNKFSNYVDKDISINNIEVKNYAEKLILPKILNSTHKFKHIGNDLDSFKFEIILDIQDLENAYLFKGPIYLEKNDNSFSLNNTLNQKKGHIINIYGEDMEDITSVKLPKKISDSSYKENNKDIDIIDNNIHYRIKNEEIKKHKDEWVINIMQKYLDSLVPLNFQSKGANPIADDSICPTKKLNCNIRELKEKLKDADSGKLSKYLEFNSNSIYKQDCYLEALKDGVRKLISLHPLEFDKELHNQLMKVTLPGIEIEEFDEDIDNDTSSDTNKKEVKDTGIKENKFYFVYPPDFNKAIETSNIREFNPYNKLKLSKIVNSYFTFWKRIDGSSFDLSEEVVSNPGFAPYNPKLYKAYGIDGGYAPVNTLFLEKMDFSNTPYPHEGIDFDGENIPLSNTDKKRRTPIISFISGTVVLLKDHKQYNYGKHMIISDGIKKLYLLGHLYDYEDGIEVGTPISPGQTVGYVGNTGNCANATDKEQGNGSHLHLSIFEFSDDFAKTIVNDDNPEKIIKSRIGTMKNSIETYSCYSNTNKKYKVVNPFDYTKERI